MTVIQKGIKFGHLLAGEWRRYQARPMKILYNWLYAYLVRKFSPGEIRMFGLADPSFSFKTHYNVISKEMADRFYMQKIARSHICMVADKTIFHSLCEKFALPVPHVYGVYDMAGGWDDDGRPRVEDKDWEEFVVRKLPEETLVKPSLGRLGQGIKLLKKAPGGMLEYGDEAYTLSGFLDKLKQECLEDDYELDHVRKAHQKALFQERLSNHEALSQFTGFKMLQTVRVCTIVTTEGQVEVLFSFLKLAGKEGLADAFNAGATGNSLAEVDLETGKIRQVKRMKQGAGYLETIDRHPNTGMAFADFRLPFAEEIVNLAEQAAQRFLPHECMGWDIAVTDNGPVLLEGNTVWTPLGSFSLSKEKLKAYGLL